MSKPVIVIGGGHAAAAFADKFRKNDTETPVIILSEESEYPYHRPPLSKKYLLGELTLDRLRIRAPEWYEELGVTVRLNTRVTKLDAEALAVTLDNGEVIEFQDAVIATGSRPRRLSAEIGGELEGVLTLRDVGDVDAMKPYFVEGKKLLIVGGGYIGLEAAAVASKLGMQVTLVEMFDRILSRVAAAETAYYFQDLHAEHGVNIITNDVVEQFIGNADDGKAGHIISAKLKSDEVIDCDVALVGIGGIANEELAVEAGISCDRGIRVDAKCQTSATHIYAVGDCCNFEYDGEITRLESVQNANAQADIAALNIAGQPTEYAPQPWFWSDQYDVKLQIAGFNRGFDATVARVGDKPGMLSVWYYRDGKLLAVDAMNDAASFAMGKKLLMTGKTPSPHDVADTSKSLKDIVAAAQ